MPTDVRTHCTHYTQIQQQEECTVLEKSGPIERSQQCVLTCTVFLAFVLISTALCLCVLGEKLFDAQQDTDALREGKNKQKKTHKHWERKKAQKHTNSAYIKIKKNENKAIGRDREREGRKKEDTKTWNYCLV